MRRFWWLWMIIGVAVLIFGLVTISSYLYNIELEKQKSQPESKTETFIYNPERDGPPPVVSLPFAPEDLPNSLVPMGETIAHPDPPNPGGHPGIDFQWDFKQVKLIASMDGTVYAITDVPENNTHDLSIKNGIWGVDMGVERINPDLKVGDPIQRGDFVGYVVRHKNDKYSNGEDYFHSIHWQFGYANNKNAAPVEKRLCPMVYFDTNSKKLIKQIWANVPANDGFKSQFPEICSGYYKKKDK